MALFTDGAISTLEDLRGYESEIYTLASTENIDLSKKTVLAQQELEVEITARFFREDPAEIRLAVVTPALKLWHRFHTLALIFRDAYNSHLNDRYQGKWKEYERQARWAYENLLVSGLGVVSEPVPRAPAPSLTAVPGSAPEGTYWVRVAWTGAGGATGWASEPSVADAGGATTLQVQIAGAAPPGVTGWNVYVGADADSATQQNAAPLEAGSAWTLPSGGLMGGAPAGQGQTPESYRRFERVFRRG